jgi:hypothetical protein
MRSVEPRATARKLAEPIEKRTCGDGAQGVASGRGARRDRLGALRSGARLHVFDEGHHFPQYGMVGTGACDTRGQRGQRRELQLHGTEIRSTEPGFLTQQRYRLAHRAAKLLLDRFGSRWRS